MMNTQVEEEKFSEFYERWMGQLEEHLVLLLKVAREDSDKEVHLSMVNKLTAHHKEFYKVKWAHEDVLAFFTPVWLSPLEKAYLWMTGWKPSIAFRLVESLKKGRDSSLVELTVEQAQKIEALRVNMKAEEERVEREMERLQMRMADENIVKLARLESLARRNGADSSRVNDLVEAALRGMLAGLQKVMKMADCVRLKTLKEVLDVLNPIQCVDFLAATSMLHLQMRRWGKAREYCYNYNQN